MTKKELEAKIEELEEELEEYRNILEEQELDYTTRKAVNMTYGVVSAFKEKGLMIDDALKLTEILFRVAGNI